MDLSDVTTGDSVTALPSPLPSARKIHVDSPTISPAAPKSLSKRFRINARKLFLTWPRCSIPKEVILKNILELLDPLVCIVSQEKHKDGGAHLHAFIEFNRKRDFRGSDYFDSIADGQHGNYQPARNRRRTILYVTKDKDYICHGIDDAGITNLKNRQALGASLDLLKADCRIYDYAMDYPEYYVKHFNGIHKFVEMVRIHRAHRNLIPFVLKPWTTSYLDKSKCFANTVSDLKLIYNWLKLVSARLPIKRKTKMLFMSGTTGTGKSEFNDRLFQHFTGYDLPGEDFYDRN
jgi:hypothetical protein